jgi:hypothetical protein
MVGEKTGIWKNFATGDSGDNLLDLLCKVRRCSFLEACKEAANWLSNPDRYGLNTHDFWRKHDSTKFSDRYSYALKPCRADNLQSGNTSDHIALSNLLEISTDGILLAEYDGVLRFFDHPNNGRCWCVVDRRNYVRQDRRLDGKPFLLRNNSQIKARTIGTSMWPIGLPTDKRIIALVEGSSDFDVEQWETNGEVRSPLSSFISKLAKEENHVADKTN